MNHSFVGALTACLALSAGSYSPTSAQPVRHYAGEVEVLVNGTPQRRYAHDGRWYVEALKGREYAIRLRNPFPVRVAIALSVDGLNTIDARHTEAADARKWVLDPYQTVTIVGWQTSRTDARKFEFTTEAGSYGQALGKTANLGMISAVFFKERVRTTLGTLRPVPCPLPRRQRRQLRQPRRRSKALAPPRARDGCRTSTPPPGWASGPITR